MTKQTLALKILILASTLALSCTHKQILNSPESEKQNLSTTTEKLTEPKTSAQILATSENNPDFLNLDLNEIDDSNRLIDSEFETQIFSPIKKFEAYQSADHSESGQTAMTCTGKKKGKELIGRWRCKDYSGRKIISIAFKNNIKNGWVREWDDHGHVMTESWWVNDHITRPARIFQKSGQKFIEGGFDNGLRNGYFIKYNENGKKIGDVYYKAGKRDGRTRIFYADQSQKLRLYYADDKPNGEYWSWYANGNIKSHGFMSNGVHRGNWQFWNQEGQKTEDRDIR